MSTRKRSHGDGGIDARGKNAYRLRYYIDGKRFTETVKGSLTDARRRLNEVVTEGREGKHIPPSRMTLAAWAEQWLTLLARTGVQSADQPMNARSKGLVSARTRERYRELLASYVLPKLGSVPLQKLSVNDVDRLYLDLEAKLSSATIRHVHVCLRSCLKVAVRKKHLKENPTDHADVPGSEETEVGTALEASEVKRLLDGFRGSVLCPMVATALLDSGIPIHVVAERLGHDPQVLLRVYAKRTKKADVTAAAAIDAWARSMI